jgi:hypothetical protein
VRRGQRRCMCRTPMSSGGGLLQLLRRIERAFGPLAASSALARPTCGKCLPADPASQTNICILIHISPRPRALQSSLHT